MSSMFLITDLVTPLVRSKAECVSSSMVRLRPPGCAVISCLLPDDAKLCQKEGRKNYCFVSFSPLGDRVVVPFQVGEVLLTSATELLRKSISFTLASFSASLAAWTSCLRLSASCCLLSASY